MVYSWELGYQKKTVISENDQIKEMWCMPCAYCTIYQGTSEGACIAVCNNAFMNFSVLFYIKNVAETEQLYCLEIVMFKLT